MNADNYSAALIGDKLVITAGSDYAASVGARKVSEHIRTNGVFKEGFLIEGKYDVNYSMAGNYSYTWGDEFNGNTIDSTNWAFSSEVKNGPFYKSTSDYYRATSGASTWSTNGSYKQDGTVTYVNNDYSVNDGILTMNTRKTAEGYTGTKISAKKNFTYGIMEMKVKFSQNLGTSFALWARSVDTYPKETCIVNEFDFAENFGTQNINPNLHTWKKFGDEHTNHGKDLDIRKKVENVNDGEYHYISMEWTPTLVRFYFDGEIYMEQDITDQETWEAFTKSTYLILSVDVPTGRYAIDSNGTTPAEQILANGGNISDLAQYSDSLYVDYIRVYQLNSAGYTLTNK